MVPQIHPAVAAGKLFHSALIQVSPELPLSTRLTQAVLVPAAPVLPGRGPSPCQPS